MAVVHKFIEGGEHYLAWALARERVLRRQGNGSAKYDLGDATLEIRIVGGQSYIFLNGENVIAALRQYSCIPHLEDGTGVTTSVLVADDVVVKQKEETLTNSVWYGADEKVMFTTAEPQGFSLFGVGAGPFVGTEGRITGGVIIYNDKTYQPSHPVLAAAVVTNSTDDKALVYATHERVPVQDAPVPPPPFPSQYMEWEPQTVRVSIWVIDLAKPKTAAPESYKVLEYDIPQNVSRTPKVVKQSLAYGGTNNVTTYFTAIEGRVDRHASVVSGHFSQSGNELGIMLMPRRSLRAPRFSPEELKANKLEPAVLVTFNVRMNNVGTVTATYNGSRPFCGGFTFTGERRDDPTPPIGEDYETWVDPTTFSTSDGEDDDNYSAVSQGFNRTSGSTANLTVDSPITFGYRGEIPVPVFMRRTVNRATSGTASKVDGFTSTTARSENGGTYSVKIDKNSYGRTGSHSSQSESAVTELMFGDDAVWSASTSSIGSTTSSSSYSNTFSSLLVGPVNSSPGNLGPTYTESESKSKSSSIERRSSDEDMAIGLAGIDVRFNQALVSHLKRTVTSNTVTNESGSSTNDNVAVVQAVTAIKNGKRYDFPLRNIQNVPAPYRYLYYIGEEFPFGSFAPFIPLIGNNAAYSKLNRPLFVSRDADSALLCIDAEVGPYQYASNFDATKYVNAAIYKDKLIDIEGLFSVSGNSFSFSPVAVVA